MDMEHIPNLQAAQAAGFKKDGVGVWGGATLVDKDGETLDTGGVASISPSILANKGYERITGLNVAKALTLPAGAAYAIIIAETQDVRFLCEGSTTLPTNTIGMPMAKGVPISFNVALAGLRFIEQAASAVLHVWYLG